MLNANKTPETGNAVQNLNKLPPNLNMLSRQLCSLYGFAVLQHLSTHFYLSNLDKSRLIYLILLIINSSELFSQILWHFLSIPLDNPLISPRNILIRSLIIPIYHHYPCNPLILLNHKADNWYVLFSTKSVQLTMSPFQLAACDGRNKGSHQQVHVGGEQHQPENSGRSQDTLLYLFLVTLRFWVSYFSPYCYLFLSIYYILK